jgi:hypothetical protein
VVARQQVDQLDIAGRVTGLGAFPRPATVTANSDSPYLFVGSLPCLRR